MKKCPFCAEEIQDEAIKCWHCGSMLTPSTTTAAAAVRPTVNPPVESQTAKAAQPALPRVWFGLADGRRRLIALACLMLGFLLTLAPGQVPPGTLITSASVFFLFTGSRIARLFIAFVAGVLLSTPGIAIHPPTPRGERSTPHSDTSTATKPTESEDERPDVMHTAAGDVKKGMTWDEALPLLGNADDHEQITENLFVNSYWVGAYTYRVTFQRPTLPELGPYTVRGFVRQKGHTVHGVSVE